VPWDEAGEFSLLPGGCGDRLPWDGAGAVEVTGLICCLPCPFCCSFFDVWSAAVAAAAAAAVVAAAAHGALPWSAVEVAWIA